jgi:hypothetical protein
MMKKTIAYLPIVAALVFTGCTKNFNSINTDPTKSSQANFDPNYLFTTAEMDYADGCGDQLFEIGPMIQVLSSTLDYYGGGDKYNSFLYSYNTQVFTNGMLLAAQLVEAKSLSIGKDSVYNSNLIQMSEILFVMDLQRITDVYGDIPYSQAGMAKYGIQFPVYDKQADIYADMLKRLDAAINKLDASKPLPTGDLIYGGDIAKWKKLGYSLMLRVAMRLTKIDPTTAQAYAEKAAPGVFTGITDNAIISMDRGIGEYNQICLDMYEVRWSKTFIDYLKNNNDPRLYALTEKSDTGLANNNAIRKAGLRYTTASPAPAGTINEVPVGMPNGYDLGGTRNISTAPGYPGPNGTGGNISPLGNYARPVVALVGPQINVSVLLMTYAQTELLLAETKVRGWNTGSTSAADHFKNGVAGAMQAMTQLSTTVAIPADSIAAYTANHPLNSSSTDSSLKMINSEYWVASLWDFAESWSNFRRSGYPALTPVNYPGNITNGTIPRRLTYPLSENSLNNVNYQAALKRMGGIDLTTLRVWWDAQ